MNDQLKQLLSRRIWELEHIRQAKNATRSSLNEAIKKLEREISDIEAESKFLGQALEDAKK